jgi:uncharacterized glyoxalase superfamily protein PhnB
LRARRVVADSIQPFAEVNTVSTPAKDTTTTIIPSLRYRDAQPDEIGGRETQACYVVLADCAHQYARAKAAGAEIVDELETRDYGGSGYRCRDPEGHLWSFGDYDPWAEHTA